MRLVTVVFGFLLQLKITHIIEGKRDLTLYNATLEGKSPKVHSCFAEIINGGLNGYLIYTYPVDNITVRSTMDAIRENKKKYRIFDFTIDICKAFREKPKNSVSLRLYLAFAKHGNVPTACPMVPNVNFTFTDFRVNAGLLPSFAPLMSFVVDIKLFMGREYIFNAIVTGKLEAIQRRNKFNLGD